MEVFEAVCTVLAVRQYQDKPVPEPIVRHIVEAAHLTASSRNGQPWQFIVVQDKCRAVPVWDGNFRGYPTSGVTTQEPQATGKDDPKRLLRAMAIVSGPAYASSPNSSESDKMPLGTIVEFAVPTSRVALLASPLGPMVTSGLPNTLPTRLAGSILGRED